MKCSQFQANWDNYHLPFLLSRDETQKFFSQRSDKFWILLAPPRIRCDVADFSSLDTQIEHRLEYLVNKHYLSNRIPYPVGCRKIFRDPIERIQAIHASELLAPIPTLVLHSVVTDQEVFITVTCPRSTDPNYQNSPDNQISLPSWNWELIKDSLEQQGQSDKESIRCIKELIIAFHIVIAIYFLDLYCLNLDPYHQPKLFDFLKESDFPEALMHWVKPYHDSLLQIQEDVRPRRTLETARNNSTSYSNYTHTYSDDGGCSPIIAIGIVIVLLFAFLGHNLSKSGSSVNTSDRGNNSQQRAKSGVIQNSRPGKNAASLRVAPDQNSKAITKLLNGTSVVLGEVNSDGTWQKVTTKDGKSGWVWAEFIQQ